MRTREYDRQAAVAYARRWALARNPAYYDFSALGGDCTNYASQSVYAGSGVVNRTPVMGWYYNSLNDRAPSWTGVEFFRNFMVGNKGPGPFAAETDLSQVLPGDIIQLGNAEKFYHSPVVTGFLGGRVLVSAHTFDALDRPLDTYVFVRYRCIHILGVREGE